MDDPTAVELFTYNRWANLALLDVCAALTPEQLANSDPGSYGTIYDTLMHIIRSEAAYYRLLTGAPLPPPFAWTDHPSLAQMRPYVDLVSSAFLGITPRFHTGTVVREEEGGEVYEYSPMVLLIQIINHGIEHRTNITTILARLGIATPEIDGWGYMEAHIDRLGA